MKFKDFLQEQKEKHAVMAFGRMNPVTVGHEKLVSTVQGIAKKVGGSAHIVVSHSQDPKKNPLTPQQKLKHTKRAFPGVNVSASDSSAPNFLSQASKLYKQGVTHFHMVGGSDRADEYKHLLNKYNNVKGPHGHFNFKNIEVHSAGDRDPDAEGVSGMSASKMREHATKGNFNEFRKGVPSKMTDAHAREMYNHVRSGMGIKEDVNVAFQEMLVEGVHDKAIFKAVFLAGGPGSGKDYVLDNTLAGHGLTEINSDKALEFLMDKKGLDKTMPASEKEKRDLVRDRAKGMTELRQRLALLGRNGLIINGTGDDAAKIERIKGKLDELGYDSSMVMVNTEDEISKQRNIERGTRGGRTVPEEIRKEKWDAVQASRPRMAELFGDRYYEFDNSQDLRQAPPEVVKQKKDEMLELFKNMQQFVSEPPSSEAASMWIAHEMDVNDRLPVPEGGAEQTPHPESAAAEEARSMGLQYYGFGRYGKDGKVTHRSIHDKLVQVEKNPKPMKEDLDAELEEFLSEDLRKWFDKDHPEGGWKRINSKGEAIGPCAREPGEPKPKCMSNEKRAKLSKKERASAVSAKRRHDPDAERTGKPINVSNFGKGKLSESYSLSDSGAMNLLLLGNRIDEVDLTPEEDTYEFVQESDKKPKYLSDKNGKIRTFMLRRAAAKEAHTKNGIVMPHKNGYVIKLNEEKNHVQSTIQPIQEETRSSGPRKTLHAFRRDSRYDLSGSGSIIAESTGTSGRESTGTSGHSSAGTSGTESTRTSGTETSTGRTEAQTTTEETCTNSSSRKIKLSEIWQKAKDHKKVKESIDKGIEPGLSMASAGENSSRSSNARTKQIKKPFEETIGAGGEDATSMSAHNDNVLKRKGINLQSFKAKRPIG